MSDNVHNKNEAGNYIWNAIGGMLNAGQSVLVLIIVTRVCGLEAAGLYSIAFKRHMAATVIVLAGE